MPGILYLIPNTLGPAAPAPADPLAHVIPIEVQSITAQLGYFIAENAKTTRAFLKLIAAQHPLAKPLQEIHISELNVNTPAAQLPALLAPIKAGQDGGLISEAGVPAVADPGANLVRLAHHEGIRVKPLVGPSSLLLAVMASGLSGQSFAFNGYLPTDATQRTKRIKTLEDRSRLERQTQLFIETPYRNAALLEALVTACKPNTLLCVATDLSLPTETIATQAISKWKQDLAAGRAPDFHKKPTVFLLLSE
ncbi:SAM-dependent methyltransferase [Noviherbaspirillum autotrophicum]|uniref:SAM-dependent methyltransferase n=1 Tax=Noviherbaspirillum autotrophicum TaxID=709839 RepID=A0A0C1YPZ0_9BURK|nr:SAM-dependent methyltransferase [Noviherbaspirillum autotrophicum]KIF82677.1 SAM-dependent methyltransferase [Noviherbaspirillum autotrophicum]